MNDTWTVLPKVVTWQNIYPLETVSTMKPILLFLHGLGSSCLAFKPLMASLVELEASYDFVAPDFYGFGSRNVPTSVEKVSMEAFADQIATELRTRKVSPTTPLHIIAHSMGGIVALELYYRHSNLLITSCINLEGNLENNPSSTSVEVSKTTRERFSQIGFQELLEATSRNAPFDLGARSWLQSLTQTKAEVFYDASVDLVKKSEDAYVRYKNWTVPGVYVFGEKTIVHSRELYRRLKADGKDLRIVPNSGHSMMIEKPRETAEICRQFLREKVH